MEFYLIKGEHYEKVITIIGSDSVTKARLEELTAPGKTFESLDDINKAMHHPDEKGVQSLPSTFKVPEIISVRVKKLPIDVPVNYETSYMNLEALKIRLVNGQEPETKP